jgi:hypothetical protein
MKIFFFSKRRKGKKGFFPVSVLKAARGHKNCDRGRSFSREIPAQPAKNGFWADFLDLGICFSRF